MSDVGYIKEGRISAEDQLVGVTLDKIFTDTPKTIFKQFDECEEYLREGDTLHVHCANILGISPSDLYGNLEKIVLKKGVKIKFHQEETVFTNDEDNIFSRFTLQCMKALADMDWIFFKNRIDRL